MIHELISLVDRLNTAKILVVGDIMLDHYVWGSVERISPEAPIPVVNAKREDMLLGGAANVANNLAALGVKVGLCGVVGRDNHAQLLKKLLKKQKISADGVFADSGRCTTLKTRILAQNQQLMRIDREFSIPVSKDIEKRVLAFFNKNIKKTDAVIISDYAKGLLTKAVLSGIINICRKNGKPVLVDPKGTDYDRYRGATLLTPNRAEAAAATGINIVNKETLDSAGERLLDITGGKAVLITCGKDGMVLYEPRKTPYHIATQAREVYDVTGAGDTVVAVLAAALATGTKPDIAARLANLAGGIVVGKMGAASVSRAELFSALHDVGSTHKVFAPKDWHTLVALLDEERQAGKRIVFTNGCFDLIHSGHIKLLQDARSFGDILVVGMNTDSSVRALKGEKRPVLGEMERAHIIASLDSVEYVALFEEKTPLNLLKVLKPDVLVKGDDYKKSEVVGADLVEGYGGTVRLVPIVTGFSTSNIVQTILDRYSGGKKAGKAKRVCKK